MMTGDIATMGALIGAGLATFGMGGAAIAVGIIVGSVFKVMPKKLIHQQCLLVLHLPKH